MRPMALCPLRKEGILSWFNNILILYVSLEEWKLEIWPTIVTNQNSKFSQK